MQEKPFDIQARISEITFKDLQKNDKPKIIQADLLSTRDICSMLEIAPSTLYRMRTYDGFPCVKVGGRKTISFNERDVEEYMKNHKLNR